MDVALGLDVSTSIVGWSIIPLDAKLGDKPLEKGHVDLRKVKGFWNKVDVVRTWMEDHHVGMTDVGLVVKRVFIEDPVKKFRRGMSSASTISLLAKFNALVSCFARDELGIDPLYIGATAARKHIGMKLVSKKKANGMNEKKQTFSQLNETVFKDEDWPLNRNGKVQPYCYDAVDSYVICMAGIQGLGEPA